MPSLPTTAITFPSVVYRGPAWRREIAGDQNEGVMHGILLADWDGRGSDSILTASFSGIDRYWLDDARW